jgi:SAM-dependent methyltransferase
LGHVAAGRVFGSRISHRAAPNVRWLAWYTACIDRWAGYQQIFGLTEDEPMSNDKDTIDWSERCWKEMLVYQRNAMWLDDTLDKLAAWMGLRPGMTAVDVGCGLGHLGYAFWPYFGRGGRYFGVDMAPDLLGDAEKGAAGWARQGEASFQVGDAYDLPLPDDFADLAMCQTLLIHLDRPEKALGEMTRVTKPGGLVICIEPDNLSVLLEKWYWSLDDLDIDDQMLLRRVALICSKGSIKLGLGDSSIGNKIPFTMTNLGLTDIGIRQNDAVFYVEPPYQDRRQRDLLASAKKQWLDQARFENLRERTRKYFVAGGGDPAEFDRYQRIQVRLRDVFRQQIEEGKYFACGTGHIYIVKGRKRG